MLFRSDPLEAPRGPKSHSPGPSTNSISTSSLSPTPNVSPSSTNSVLRLPSYRAPAPNVSSSSTDSVLRLPSYKEARLKRVGMACANCGRTGVLTHYRGPTGYTLCDACHRLWVADRRPFSWRGLGQNVIEPALSANDRQPPCTPAPHDSDHFNYTFDSRKGHAKSKPSQALVMTPAEHTSASMKHPSAGDTAGSSFEPPSSKKRDHGATQPSDHNRPYKIPKKIDAILSLFDKDLKNEIPETREVRESPKEKSAGAATKANNDKTASHGKPDGKKGLENTVQAFTMLCRKLFDLEKLEKEDQARIQRGEQALEEAKKKKTGHQKEITGLVVTMNNTEKTLAKQRDSIAKHVGRKHGGYQQLVQSFIGQEAKRQKHQERFLELAREDMEADDEETPEGRIKRYKRDLEDTTRELKEVREKLRK